MRAFIFSLLILTYAGVAAQGNPPNTQLAQQYYQDGEYEKAALIYELLAEAHENNDFFFDRYINCLLRLEDYDTADQAIKKRLRKKPNQVKLYVTYGQLLEQQFDQEGADEQYNTAIERLTGDQFQTTQLANNFIRYTKYDFAIRTYERGSELMGDDQAFAYNLADLYRRKGDTEQMIEYYLLSVTNNPGRAETVRTIFQRSLDRDGLQLLQEQLYTLIQESPADNVVFPEMLAWVFIQRKDYSGALRQARALDRRLDENGMRVYNLGRLAANAKDYETAIAAFDYIVERKGEGSTLYLDAKREGLLTRRRAITDGYDYNENDLRILEEAYLGFLTEFGTNPRTANISIQLAELEALYLNDLDQAITLLNRVINMAGVDPRVMARAKLALGDYYLMQGEIWESTLLYSQVDKAFEDDLLGHEARFRNARLSYFKGDFEWAQSQFDVLKASTSKLIANDALDLSVFIIDNLGLDTTATALQTYADAELLVFQNRFDEAFATLDILAEGFPGHELQDDILYLKAEVYLKRREYERAAQAYQTIINDHSDGIRVDNSLFALAGLYENYLDDQQRAMELYETLFIDYSNSILAVEGRQSFRRLRGDEVQ
ncbi:MAG: tetratricopeptide repeat protein [Bacteroidota bacterium]